MSKEKALEYLTKHNLDLEGCAKKLKISLAEMIELRDDNLKEFQALESQFLAKLEGQVAKAALGNPPENFNASLAKWVLERRSSKWNNKQQVIKTTEKPESNGQGADIVDKFLERKLSVVK